MSRDHNEGIIISGGKLTAKAVAVGRGASAQVSAFAAADLGELQGLLSELSRKLEQEGAGSTDPFGEVKQAVQSVQQELSQPKPSRLTVTALLEAIASSVKAVASLATIVETARQLVEKIF